MKTTIAAAAVALALSSTAAVAGAPNILGSAAPHVGSNGAAAPGAGSGYTNHVSILGSAAPHAGAAGGVDLDAHTSSTANNSGAPNILGSAAPHVGSNGGMVYGHDNANNGGLLASPGMAPQDPTAAPGSLHVNTSANNAAYQPQGGALVTRPGGVVLQDPASTPGSLHVNNSANNAAYMPQGSTNVSGSGSIVLQDPNSTPGSIAVNTGSGAQDPNAHTPSTPNNSGAPNLQGSAPPHVGSNGGQVHGVDNANNGGLIASPGLPGSVVINNGSGAQLFDKDTAQDGEIADNAAGIAANAAHDLTQDQVITANANQIHENANGIAANAAAAAGAQTTATNAQDSANDALAAAGANAAHIATNTTAIAANTAGVSANAAGVANNAAVNTRQDATLSQHSAAIAGNTQAINDLAGSTNSRFNSLKRQIDDNKDRADAGIAGVAAMANIPQVTQGQTFAVGAGVGGFGGESALAVGGSYRVNEHVVTKFSVSDNSQNDVGVGAGVSYGW